MAEVVALLLGQMVLVGMAVTAELAVAVAVAGRKVVQREETAQPIPGVKAAMVQAALVEEWVQHPVLFLHSRVQQEQVVVAAAGRLKVAELILQPEKMAQRGTHTQTLLPA